MRILTKGGALPYTRFTFPDGQPHIRIEQFNEFREATIETAIRNPTELFELLLAKDILTGNGFKVSLNIRYLLGARMDRPIDQQEPFTLSVVARLLNTAGFFKIRILDPHSSVSSAMLGAETVWPTQTLRNTLAHYLPSETCIIIPDKGATDRVREQLKVAGHQDVWRLVQCQKERDTRTGKLLGFSFDNGYPLTHSNALILDDICDGGGTFVGLAALLRDKGVQRVDLFVTHGIFSKGGKLEGIDTIYTTDSYNPVGKVIGPITNVVYMTEGKL